MKQMIRNLIGAVSLIYIMMFLLVYFSPVEIFEAAIINEMFTSYEYVLPAFIISVLSFISLGKAFAIEEANCIRYRLLRDMDYKKERLVEYITLAKIITKDDTKTLIDNYIKKLEKEKLKNE